MLNARSQLFQIAKWPDQESLSIRATPPSSSYATSTSQNSYNPFLHDFGSLLRYPPFDLDSEKPPRIPEELGDRHSYYGFEFTDADLARYEERHPKAEDASRARTPAPAVRKENLILEHTRQLGISMRYRLDRLETRRKLKKDDLSSRHDFVWFAAHHMPRFKPPTKAKLSELLDALGVEGELKWLTI